MSNGKRVHKGSLVPIELAAKVNTERRAHVPPLSWSQMIEKIIAERYAQK
jgi:hypothetical protein